MVLGVFNLADKEGVILQNSGICNLLIHYEWA